MQTNPYDIVEPTKNNKTGLIVILVVVALFIAGCITVSLVVVPMAKNVLSHIQSTKGVFTTQSPDDTGGVIATERSSTASSYELAVLVQLGEYNHIFSELKANLEAYYANTDLLNDPSWKSDTTLLAEQLVKESKDMLAVSPVPEEYAEYYKYLGNIDESTGYVLENLKVDYAGNTMNLFDLKQKNATEDIDYWISALDSESEYIRTH